MRGDAGTGAERKQWGRFLPGCCVCGRSQRLCVQTRAYAAQTHRHTYDTHTHTHGALMPFVEAGGIFFEWQGEGPVGGKYCSMGWGGPAVGMRLSENRWIQLYCVRFAHRYVVRGGGRFIQSKRYCLPPSPSPPLMRGRRRLRMSCQAMLC